MVFLVIASMAEGKWIAGIRADMSAPQAARHVLQARFEPVPVLLELARQQGAIDTEHVHKLRVGIRRAEAALRIFADCLPDKLRRRTRRKLRRIRRAAGQARDWDVFLMTLAGRRVRNKADAAGLAFLSGYGQGQRAAAQKALEEIRPASALALEHFLSELVVAIRLPRSNDPVLSAVGRLLLSQRLNEFQDAARAELATYEQLHQVRIKGKRLRYAMEVLGGCFPAAFKDNLYPAIESLQDILGLANDSHVAARHLSASRDWMIASQPVPWNHFRDAVESFLRYHQRRLLRQRRAFLAWRENWQDSGNERLFQQLLAGC
jgi:CHAD domain-containing protein